MGMMQRLRRLDERVGFLGRAGLSRRDYLAKLANSRIATAGPVPAEVYAELVDLHDKVARLERVVDQLQRQQT